MVMMATPCSATDQQQLDSVEQWFENCSGAQQAVIAVRLLSRADPRAAHLIHNFLHQRLLVASAIWRLEIQQANDPAFLNGLRNESRDVAVSQLLHYLPLLRPANADGVRGYVQLLPNLLASFLDDDQLQANPTAVAATNNGQYQSSEMQQLLTYALVHPALSLESKRSLAELIRKLDEDGSQEMALSLLDNNNLGLDTFHSAGGRWDPWSSPNPGLCASTAAQQQRVRRSNSLTQPGGGYPSTDPWCVGHYHQDMVGPPSGINGSLNTNGQNGRIKPRSLSLSSPGEVATAAANGAGGLPHCPLSPQNSLASSGSGSGSDSIYSDENHRPASFQVPGSGMKDVPSWLKSLRLHKYAHLFSLLSYEEMLALSEEQLELQGVTKGARHKIALSIARLRERPSLLAQLEKEVVDTGSLHNALTELKTILGTPIKPYHGPPAGDDSMSKFYAASLSPSPSPLVTRDDTSGYSSLDGSMDNLAPRTTPTPFANDRPMAVETVDLQPAPRAKSLSIASSDMPTVIVSAAPDMDSAEEGSDTSCDDGLGGVGEGSLSGSFRSAFGAELELLGPSHLSQDDLPGQITRLLGKICTQLLVSAIPAEENVSQFVSLLDRCLSHDAFTQRQRRRIASWKEQAHRIWRFDSLPSVPPGRNSSNGVNSCTGPGLPKTPNSESTSTISSSSSRCFARRWSNVAHYPGFYNTDSAVATSTAAVSNSPAPFSNVQPPLNAYSLFPPRQHLQQQQQQQQQHRHSHSGPSQSSQVRPPFGVTHAPTHNSFGQHNHLLSTGAAASGSSVRQSLAPMASFPLNHSHSLQVGSHLPLQHRNSFCVSTLSHQSASSPLYGGGYSPLSSVAPDPFSFSQQQQCSSSHFDDLPSESFVSRLGIQRARSAPMANGDTSEMDLNHRLESLCLSMTEHALEGANDS